jgi:F-type H+-transporting ATPase subunit delta
MSARSAARRYAAVLFEVVNKSGGDLARTERELDAFVGLVAGHAELHKVLTSPALPAARKRSVVEAIVQAAGAGVPEVQRLLLMLAERDRLAHLAEVADAFRARVMAHQKIMDAEIVTAQPLADDRKAALAKALSAASGADVRVTESINPEIVGGLIARVGSVVFDASLTRQLEKMRQQLLAQA